MSGASSVRGVTRQATAHETVLVPFAVFLAVVADRLQLSVATGGTGVLSLLALIAPGAALLVLVRRGSRRSVGFLGNPVFLCFVLPYVFLSGLLPFLGVMFYGYPVRTLFGATALTTALALLVIGAAVAGRDGRAWAPWVFLAIVVQFGYALGQAIYLVHGPGWQLFAPFHDWDLSLQTLDGVLVQGRSSGLYFNPNELGLWAGMAAIIGWGILPSRMRIVGVTLAVGTLLLSQSRGATVALVVAGGVAAAVALTRGRVSAGQGLKALAAAGIVAGLVACVAILVGVPATLLPRFDSLAAVLTQGPQADANLAGRLDYWRAVTALNAFYPWGTWGPPELLLGTAVDSSWFQAFAQGSVPYAAALGMLLLGAFAFAGSQHRRILAVLAVFIAVAGLTQTPFGYPPIVLFWVLLGSALQRSVTERANKTASPAAVPHWPPADRARQKPVLGSRAAD